MTDKWASYVDRVCETCRAAFRLQWQSVVARGGKYCSRQCTPNWHNRGKFKSPLGSSHSYVERSCETCGSSFSRQVKVVERGGGRFCCRGCNPAYQRAQPKSVKARRHNLKSKYGITEAEYEEAVILQNGLCLICNGKADWKHDKLVVDHCHSTGLFRGLLCHRCNIVLGHGRDDPDVLRRAADYLDRHKAQG